MLAQIRAFAKSPIATVLLGLLVVSFGVWGIKDVFRTAGFTDAVVQAGSRPPVTSAQFKDLFNQNKAQKEQQAGQPITVDEAVKYGLDRNLIDELTANEATGALMSSEGINPSDTLVAGEIRKIPAFFNPVTGQFDAKAYQVALAERHLTEVTADNEFRDVIAQRQYVAGLAGGLYAPRIYALVQAAFEREGRDFTWFTLAPSAVPAPAKPTDATLQAFIKEHAAQLTRPELRQLSLVHFSAELLAQTLPAADAEVQKRFDFEKDTLSAPEKRSLVVIAVKDAKIGAELAAKLKAGGDPQALAKAVSTVAAVYPPTPKAAIADRKVADAAFAAKAGEVMGPVQGDLGLSVFKVLAVSPAKTVTLAEARPKIELEVKREAAKEKIYDVVQKYDDAHSGGAAMADAAKAAGQPVITVPAPILQNGGTLDGGHANIPQKVLQAAFTLPQGGESDAIDLGQGEYWVVHVDKVLAPALLGLDEKIGKTTVREAVTRQVMLRDMFVRLKAKADALTAEIAKGKTLEAAAAEVGAKTVEAKDVLRSAARPTQPNQPPAYSADLLGRLFTAKTGDVVVGEDTKPGLIVAKLTRISEPPPPMLAGAALAQRELVKRALFQDIGSATRLAAVRKVRPTSDYKLARKTLGVEQDTEVPGKPKS